MAWFKELGEEAEKPPKEIVLRATNPAHLWASLIYDAHLQNLPDEGGVQISEFQSREILQGLQVEDIVLSINEGREGGTFPAWVLHP